MSSRLLAALRNDAGHVIFQRSFVVHYLDTREHHHLGPVCVDKYALPMFHVQKLQSVNATAAARIGRAVRTLR